MTINEFLSHQGGVKAIGSAKIKDGGISYNAMKTLKAYNKAVEDYNEMLTASQKELETIENIPANKEAREKLGRELEKKLKEAGENEVEFTPPRIFKVSELILPENPYEITPFNLQDLDALGALEE